MFISVGHPLYQHCSAFGLWIDGDINHGSSAKCLAYGNLPLVKEGQFKIIDVEVFIFTDAMWYNPYVFMNQTWILIFVWPS